MRIVTVAILVAALAGADPSMASGPPEIWAPVPPGLLAESAAAVSEGAAAEYVAFDEWILLQSTTSLVKVTRERWARIKVLTGAGAQAVSMLTYDLPSGGGRLEEFEARVTSPDGSISESNRADAVHETLVRVGRHSLRRWTLAVPRVRQGSVVDYRIRSTTPVSPLEYTICPLAFSWPARRISYHLKVRSDVGIVARHRLHRADAQVFEGGRGEFREIRATRVPAWEQEEWAPPDAETEPVMLAYLGAEAGGDAGEFWQNHGRRLGSVFEQLSLPGARAQERCAALIAGIPAPLVRLERIVRWVRERFVVIDDEAPAPREGLRPADTPDQAIAQGGGSGLQSLFALGALARAAGLEARLVLANSSTVGFFDPDVPLSGQLPAPLVAVRVGPDWRYLDPTLRHLPWDMVSADVEGRQALLCSPTAAPFVTIPFSGADRNGLSRRMELQCAETGGLAGSCRIVARGHFAALLAAFRREMASDGRDTIVRRLIAPGDPGRRFVFDPSKLDTTGESRAEIPGGFSDDHAVTVTGRRMLLEAATICASRPPALDRVTRRTPVELPMAMTEEDSIAVWLPPGWRIETIDPPAEKVVPGVLAYRCEWSASADGRRVVLRRTLALGIGGRIRFPASAYANLRTAFAEITEHDRLSVTFVRDDER